MKTIKPKLIPSASYSLNIVRLAVVHYFVAAAFAVQTMAFDAWGLITPEVVLQRWIAIAAILVVTTVVWYIAKTSEGSVTLHKMLVLAIVLLGIAIASYIIYSQRGMASRGIALYALPIISSAVLLSRTAVFATAVLCISAYVTTAVAYFVLNFNEGYKIELYGEVGFYSAFLLILASLISIVIRTKKATQ